MPPRKKTNPRPPLSRERACRAALELADAGGLDQVSMRKVADALGVEAMSLYHHVANKDALLDGMVDLVFAEMELPRDDVDWKTAMRARATSARDAMVRHPWALRWMDSRTSPGPATLIHHDAVLGRLRRAGFSIPLTAHAYAAIDSYVYGFVLTETSLPFESTEESHEVVADIFSAFEPGAYPHLVEFATEHVMKPGYSYADEFDYGLALVLDGLERALERERADASGTLG